MTITTDHWLHSGRTGERAIKMIECAVNLYRRPVPVLEMTGSKNTNAPGEIASSPDKLLPLSLLKRDARGRQSLSRWQYWHDFHRGTKPGKIRLGLE